MPNKTEEMVQLMSASPFSDQFANSLFVFVNSSTRYHRHLISLRRLRFSNPDLLLGYSVQASPAAYVAEVICISSTAGTRNAEWFCFDLAVDEMHITSVDDVTTEDYEKFTKVVFGLVIDGMEVKGASRIVGVLGQRGDLNTLIYRLTPVTK